MRSGASTSRIHSRNVGRTLLVGGTGLLLGAASAAALLVSTGRIDLAEAATVPASAAVAAAPTSFVPVERMLLPVVRRDGSLAGYVYLDFTLEVPLSAREHVKHRLPLVRHAINLDAAHVSLGDDAASIDVAAAATLARDAAREALGAERVLSAQILAIAPA